MTNAEPKGGYNLLIEGLLKDIEVKLNTDYFENRSYFDHLADKIVFTLSLIHILKGWWRTSAIKKDLKKDRIDIFHGLSHEIP